MVYTATFGKINIFNKNHIKFKTKTAFSISEFVQRYKRNQINEKMSEISAKHSEPISRRCSVKKTFLKNFQNSQAYTCATWVSFLIELQAEGYYRTCPVATSENLHSQYKFDSTNLKKGWFYSHFLHSWSFCGIKEKNCQVFMKVFIFILLNCYCMKKCPNTEFFQLFLKYTHENVKICIYSNIFDKIAWTNSPS